MNAQTTVISTIHAVLLCCMIKKFFPWKNVDQQSNTPIYYSCKPQRHSLTVGAYSYITLQVQEEFRDQKNK